MLTQKQINNLLKEIKFSKNDAFLTNILEISDSNYHIIKAYETLHLNKSEITREELISVCQQLMLAILKIDSKVIPCSGISAKPKTTPKKESKTKS